MVESGLLQEHILLDKVFPRQKLFIFYNFLLNAILFALLCTAIILEKRDLPAIITLVYLSVLVLVHFIWYNTPSRIIVTNARVLLIRNGILFETCDLKTLKTAVFRKWVGLNTLVLTFGMTHQIDGEQEFESTNSVSLWGLMGLESLNDYFESEARNARNIRLMVFPFKRIQPMSLFICVFFFGLLIPVGLYFVILYGAGSFQ